MRARQELELFLALTNPNIGEFDMAKARFTTEPVSQATPAADHAKVAANLAKMVSANESVQPSETHQIIHHNLRLMTMKELNSLYEALEAANMTLLGIFNMPRFYQSDRMNAAGEELESLIDHLGKFISAVVNTAENAQPTKDAIETEARAWLLLKFNARCEDNLYRFTRLVGEEVVNLSSAEFYEKWKKETGDENP